MKVLMRTAIPLVILVIIFVGHVSAQMYECPEGDEGSKHGNLGAKYWAEGRYELAEKETRLAIKHQPDCSMWHQNLGFILLEMGRSDEAEKSLLMSIKKDSLWCHAYKTGSLLALGMYYYQEQSYEDSIYYLTEAIEMAETEDVDYGILSVIYLYLSYNFTDSKEDGNPYFDLEKAEIYKKKALALNPDDYFIRASMTKLLVLQGKLTEARKNLSEIVQAQEESKHPSASVYSYIAHIYSLLHDSKKSALFIDRAIDLDPMESSRYLLGFLQRDFKDVASTDDMQPVIERARRIVNKED